MNPLRTSIRWTTSSAALNLVRWWIERNRQHCFDQLLWGASMMTCLAVQASTNSVEVAVTTTNRCAESTLNDQFLKSHELKFPREKPTVLTVADRKGSEDIVGWAHPLAEKFGDKIIVDGLADVSSVPGPLRSMVQSKFKKAIQYPVMLDWEGDATRSFNYTKGKANVYLLSTDGRILHHLAGKADDEKLKTLEETIEREIKPSTQEKARGN